MVTSQDWSCFRNKKNHLLIKKMSKSTLKASLRFVDAPSISSHKSSPNLKNFYSRFAKSRLSASTCQWDILSSTQIQPTNSRRSEPSPCHKSCMERRRTWKQTSNSNFIKTRKAKSKAWWRTKMTTKNTSSWAISWRNKYTARRKDWLKVRLRKMTLQASFQKQANSTTNLSRKLARKSKISSKAERVSHSSRSWKISKTSSFKSTRQTQSLRLNPFNIK